MTTIFTFGSQRFVAQIQRKINTRINYYIWSVQIITGPTQSGVRCGMGGGHS